MDDSDILSSWRTNAAAWARAIDERSIESRRLVTDGAVIDAVLSLRPASVVDVGCGEGWLARTLASRGLRVVGVDGVPALVDGARTRGGDVEYVVATYGELATIRLPIDDLDVAVCNFSLIGRDDVDSALRALRARVRRIVIQTLHPVVAGGELPYVDGWRPGSWAGFSDDFVDPAPWYFRTIESWVAMLVGAGFVIEALREPLHPRTQRPASLVLIAR